jgi:hypothetical protein
LAQAWNTLIALGYRACETDAARTPIPEPRNGDVLWLHKG